MSHITKIELEVKDLGILSTACNRLGLTFKQNQKSYKWYGREEAECAHAISIPGATYEIGVIDRSGKFDLSCDFFDHDLRVAIGDNGGRLKQAYAVEKAKIEARRKGYSVLEKRIDNGIRLHVRMA